jgi:hypothetical protein
MESQDLNLGPFEKGMHVTINQDISKTDRIFQSCNDMWSMRGNMYRIDSVNLVYGSESAVVVNSFNWHPDDITLVCPEKESQMVLFNIEELEL